VSLHIIANLRKRDQALVTRTNYLRKRDQALVTRTNHLRKKDQVLATRASYLGEGVSQNQALIARDNCRMRSVRITAHASYLGEGVPLRTRSLSQRPVVNATHQIQLSPNLNLLPYADTCATCGCAEGVPL
jgi:hypothetical protein